MDVNARVINSTFLSTSERFAPPRDMLLEEPDTANPGEQILLYCTCMHTCNGTCTCILFNIM